MTAKLTPAEKGILAAKSDAQKLIAAAEAGAEALDQDGYPSWEKIANVHRKSAEAYQAKVKEQNKTIDNLNNTIHDLKIQLKNAWEEIENLEIENKNT